MPADFLRHILPVGGNYCIARIRKPRNGGRPVATHHWFDTVEAAAANAVAGEDGVDTYFACASYSEPTKRTQANVHAVKAFWLDIDLKGSPYETVEQAALAVLAFCQTVNIPLPFFVFTGGGLHTYWVTDINLPGATWRRYADGLKSLAAKHGLHTDPSRTSDQASILRVPTTFNFKYTPAALVRRVSNFTGPYPISDFACFLEAKTTPKSRAATAGSGSTERREINKDTDADVLAHNCPQIAHLRDTGSDSEPHWYACANTLKHCTNGLERWHEWSAQYEGYDKGEADAKMAHAIGSGSGPTTCARFESIAPERCAGCRFKGRIGAALNSANHKDTTSPQKPPETIVNAEDETEETIPAFPHGYGVNEDGSLIHINATLGDLVIANGEIRLVGVRESKQHREFVFKIRDKRQQHYSTVVLPARMVQGGTIGDVWDAGFYVYEPQRWREYIKASLEALTNMQDKDTLYEHFGWQDDGKFLLGNRLYYPATGDKPQGCVRGYVHQGMQQRADRMGPVKGAQFKPAIVALEQVFSQASSQQIGHCFMAAGSILTPFTGNQEGGIASWDFGAKSGDGKTVMMTAIELMYGQEGCLKISENDTVNASAALFGVMHNLPVLIDDPKNGNDGAMFKALMERFVAGREKLALDQNRRLRDGVPTWCLTLAGASNFAPNDHLTNQTKRRILTHRETPRKIDKTCWPRIHRALTQNAGAIMHEVMKRLMTPGYLDKAIARIAAWTDALNTEYKFDTSDRFVVSGIAQAMTMLELVVAVSIEEHSPLTVDKEAVLRALVASARNSMEQADDNSGGTPQEIFGAFLNAKHRNTAFIHALSASDPRPQVNKEQLNSLQTLDVVHDSRDGTVYVLRAAFNKWLKQEEYGTVEIYAALKAAGVLVEDSSKVRDMGVVYKTAGIAGTGYQRYLVFKYVPQVVSPEQP